MRYWVNRAIESDWQFLNINYQKVPTPKHVVGYLFTQELYWIYSVNIMLKTTVTNCKATEPLENFDSWGEFPTSHHKKSAWIKHSSIRHYPHARSEYRTTPRGSFIKRQDTCALCWKNCIGCRWSSTSPTSWPCWLSRYDKHQHRCISVGSRHITACSGTRALWSSVVLFLDVLFRWTAFCKRSFSCAAPTSVELSISFSRQI